MRFPSREEPGLGFLVADTGPATSANFNPEALELKLEPSSGNASCSSSLNARAHRFTASTFAVVRLEELDEIARLKQDLVAVYQPVNSQELFALEQMALAPQTMLRAYRLESGLFTTCLDQALDLASGRTRPA